MCSPDPEDVARLEMVRACRAELGRLADEMEASQHLSMDDIAEALRKAVQLRLWLHDLVHG